MAGAKTGPIGKNLLKNKDVLSFLLFGTRFAAAIFRMRIHFREECPD